MGTPPSRRQDWAGRDAHYWASRAFELARTGPGWWRLNKARGYWQRALDMGYQIENPNGELVQLLEGRSGGGGRSQRFGVDPEAVGLPTVDVDWDELARVVEHGNPRGAQHAAHYRQMGANERATGSTGPAPGQAGTGLGPDA